MILLLELMLQEKLINHTVKINGLQWLSENL